MANVRIREFYRYVKPYVPALPEPALDTAILESAIDFCRRARCLRYAADEVEIVPGVSVYDDLNTEASEADIFEIIFIYARFGNNRHCWLEPSRQELHDPADKGTPAFFWMPGRNAVTIWPEPVQAGAFVAHAAMCPKSAANSLDEILLRDWNKGVAAGAIAALLLTPGQDATNVQAFQQINTEEINRAANIAAQSNVRAQLHVKARNY